MKRFIAVLLMLGVVAAGVAYNLRGRAAGAKQDSASSSITDTNSVPVTVSAVRERALRRTVTLTGTLRADRQASISAQSQARIIEVLVKAGDSVRVGQPLVRLDSRAYTAQIRGANAGIQTAQAQLGKAEEGKRARSLEMDSQIAQSKGALATARARLTQAELGLKLTQSTTASDSARAAAAVRQAEAGLRQADAGLAQANDALNRQRFLYSKGGAARIELEAAESQTEIAKALHDSAVAALEQARAAERPATETQPLRGKVSEADIVAARAGVNQAEDALRAAHTAKASALKLADRDIDAARAQVNQARAGRSQAESQIGNGTLTSPVEGVVSNVISHAGEIAQPGQPLLTVLARSSVFLDAAAPARYASMIRAGQDATVTFDSAPGEEIEAQVSRVLPEASLDGRSMTVQIRLAGGGVKLTPGAMARAELDLANNDSAASVPVDALRNEGGSTFVYVVTEGKAQRRNVKLGATEGAYAQVISGANRGEVVVVSGPVGLQTGTPVNVVGRE